MHREHGGSGEFRRRIMHGLREHNDGGHERIKRASGGNVPARGELNRAEGGELRKGGRVHHRHREKHRECHSWGDFVSGLGDFMKTALPIAAQVLPMMLKSGGAADGGTMRRGGRVHRKHHEDGGSADASAMRHGGRAHRRHHADGDEVECKAAGGVGKLRHGMMNRSR